MRILITQPYVPAYRVPLFGALTQQLMEDGHEVVLVAGKPAPNQGQRGDAVTQGVALAMRELLIRLPRDREVRLRLLPRSLKRATFDIVVSELDPSNIFIWVYHLRRPRVPVILWGHGASFVSRGSRLSGLLRALLVRSTASAVMTYSNRGAALLETTLKGSRTPIIAVGNSTDTAFLRNARDSLTPDERDVAHRLSGSGARALFVGGLDASKNIHELLAAARYARSIDESFKLIVVGQGALQEEISSAVSDGAVIWVPVARGRELAAIAQRCESIWMPGRVGLVAVDALALGLPLITVQHERHAPELDFLEPGEVHFVDPDPRAFAVEAREAARVPHREREAERLPSVERVAGRIREVITDLQSA
jgi:glycosyltransferase involved in cell wall biosynthesis